MEENKRIVMAPSRVFNRKEACQFGSPISESNSAPSVPPESSSCTCGFSSRSAFASFTRSQKLSHTLRGLEMGPGHAYGSPSCYSPTKAQPFLLGDESD